MYFRSKIYDTSDRRDLLGGYSPQTSEIPPQEFQDCLYFYVVQKMNRYCIAARLSSKSNL